MTERIPRAPVPRRIERILQTRHVFLSLIGTTMGLVLLFGFLITIVDREEFPSLGLALWWAIGTVSTVGYGDIVPEQTSGRIIAALLMVVGLAFLSLITATVASALVARASGPNIDEEILASLERLERRLDELERS